ncbi:hypothetical protein NL676_027559 [Syzygium grande]|nr:hypothetical protein NL676_027559 [Syzygium grande]
MDGRSAGPANRAAFLPRIPAVSPSLPPPADTSFSLPLQIPSPQLAVPCRSGCLGAARPREVPHHGCKLFMYLVVKTASTLARNLCSRQGTIFFDPDPGSYRALKLRPSGDNCLGSWSRVAEFRSDGRESAFATFKDENVVAQGTSPLFFHCSLYFVRPLPPPPKSSFSFALSLLPHPFFALSRHCSPGSAVRLFGAAERSRLRRARGASPHPLAAVRSRGKGGGPVPFLLGAGVVLGRALLFRAFLGLCGDDLPPAAASVSVSVSVSLISDLRYECGDLAGGARAQGSDISEHRIGRPVFCPSLSLSCSRAGNAEKPAPVEQLRKKSQHQETEVKLNRGRKKDTRFCFLWA